MNVSVKKSGIEGHVSAPPSKSYTHRAILGGLYSDELEIHNPLISADTKSSIHCAELLGAETERTPQSLRLDGVDGEPITPNDVMNCGNSGTTLRLFTGAASLVDQRAVLTGDDSLRSRPNSPLLSSIEDLGGDALSTRGNGQAPIVVGTGLDGGNTSIDGSVSSQFISSLLFAAPVIDSEEVSIDIEGELVSKPYVDITLEVLDELGIDIKETDQGFNVKGGQRYRSKNYRVPGDFSSASYPLAAGAIAGNVEVDNLYPGAQGDRYILNYLDKMGAVVDWDKENGVAYVSMDELSAVDFDAANNPDLVPTVAVLASVASGETVVYNAEHLRYKETDRLDAISTELSKMNADIEVTDDGLIINGDASDLSGATVSSWDDHRIAMALILAGITADGETTVQDTECIDVSYPGFIEDFSSLGADISQQ